MSQGAGRRLFNRFKSCQVRKVGSILARPLSGQIIGLLAIAGLLGPISSGFIMTAVTEGRAGIRRWLRRIVRWRVGLRSYLFTLIGLPVFMVLGTLVRPGALASFDLSAQPFTLAYVSAFVLMFLTGGPLFEEPGWSGFAQPRLQRLHGPLVGGLILGSLWALWHLPGFLIPSQDLTDIPPRGTVLDFVVFAVPSSPSVSSSCGSSTTREVACLWPSWCTLPGTPFTARP